MTDATPVTFRIIGGDGQEYGPVDLATLQEWIRQRRVAAPTKVWDSRTGNWQPAVQIPELAQALGIAPLPPAVIPPLSFAVPRTNTLAVWSLSLAVFGLNCCGCLSVPAIILGAISLSQINTRGEGGRGLAIAGIAIGIFSLVLSLLLGLFWTVFRCRVEGLGT
ncbi:MAG: DUF4190 domain-containing protein [Verrucomicrobia bacterium]|nr:DUF4190 domain-containing protein [Verrucomicrobiota bacterium]